MKNVSINAVAVENLPKELIFLRLHIWLKLIKTTEGNIESNKINNNM
jgi:hypothetical protein